MHHGIATAIASDFWIADEIARNFRNEKQLWPFFIAKRIATATVSLPQNKRLLESGQASGHHLQLFNVGGLTMKPTKIAAYSFDHVKESLTSTANHRRESVLLGGALRAITQRGQNHEMMPFRPRLLGYVVTWGVVSVATLQMLAAKNYFFFCRLWAVKNV